MLRKARTYVSAFRRPSALAAVFFLAASAGAADIDVPSPGSSARRSSGWAVSGSDRGPAPAALPSPFRLDQDERIAVTAPEKILADGSVPIGDRTGPEDGLPPEPVRLQETALGKDFQRRSFSGD